MTRNFIRNLIAHTIANVTGEDLAEILKVGTIEVDTRDWEQIFGRLESTLDLTSGEMMSTGRAIDLDALARLLAARLGSQSMTGVQPVAR